MGEPAAKSGRQVCEEVCERVNRELGWGCFSEAVFQAACEAELRRCGIHYSAQVIAPIMYSGVCVGHVRADLLVGGDSVWQFDASPSATQSTLNQAKFQAATYAKLFSVPNAFVIHFSTSAGGLTIIDAPTL